MSADAEMLEQFCIELAESAGSLLRERFERREDLNESLKSPRNVVTQADLDAERLLREMIERRFPEHAIVGEEFSARQGRGIRWFIDPLDGTTNYSFGVPHWAVSIAACDEEGELAAAVYDPMCRELFHARRAGGAYLAGRRLEASTKSDPTLALVATGFAPMRGHEPDNTCIDLFSRILPQIQGIRRCGSAALDLAYVAAGRFDLFFESSLGAWDLAAGALLVKESGGVIADYEGGADYLSKGSVVAGSDPLVRFFWGVRSETPQA